MKKHLLGMTCALALVAGGQAAERIPATAHMLSATGSEVIFQTENTAVKSEAAKLLFHEDFESNSTTIKLRDSSTTIVNSNNYSGNYSLRGNLMRNTVDPITGLAGGATLTDMNDMNWISSDQI